MEKRHSIGTAELIRRATELADQLPANTVFIGFSMGASLAEYLALTNRGCRGAVLISGADDPAEFEAGGWPLGVAVQLHYLEEDPWIDKAQVDALIAAVSAKGASIDKFTYPGRGHLFTDPDLPEYDAVSSVLLFGRVLEFLARM
jgi:dienelactone hydrolase